MFKAIRVLLLSLVLVAVVSWGFTLRRLREERTQWQRTLHVAVVLMADEQVPGAPQVDAWEEGLKKLEDWMALQYREHTDASLELPVRFTVVGSVAISALPPLRPASASLLDRARHWYGLRQFLESVHAAASMDPKAFDARIYVHLRPKQAEGPQLTEGVGEAGGDIGIVQAPLEERDLTLPLVAVAHELLHCLGASDKYDAAGHAVVPEGLVDPLQNPIFPQPQAEVMVGERPVTARKGEVPRKLRDVAIGPATAREIRWAGGPVTAR